MSDGITARSYWRQKHGLGMIGANPINSVNQVVHYNPTGPNQEEISKILVSEKTPQEILETADRWKDLDRGIAFDKIVESTDSIDTIRDASEQLFQSDISILKVENIGDENFKKINDLVVEETVRIEEAAIAELQAQIEEVQNP